MQLHILGLPATSSADVPSFLGEFLSFLLVTAHVSSPVRHFPDTSAAQEVVVCPLSCAPVVLSLCVLSLALPSFIVISKICICLSPSSILCTVPWLY